jgi:ubiquinone/menaquinone biosynthesis C-methylase UbiE
MNHDAKFWDDIAERYAKKAVPNPEAYQRKLTVTKERLRREDRILDVGCGTGSLALELAPHVAHVDAIDLSSAMIDIAKEKAKRRGIHNVTFHNATLDDNLPFEPESFQGICAYNLLHLVHDRTGTVGKIFALLKAGGFFISSTVCLGESYVPYGLILPVMRWLGKAPAVHIFRVDELVTEIQQAGFEQLAMPRVGANATTGFLLANKPIAQRHAA